MNLPDAAPDVWFRGAATLWTVVGPGRVTERFTPIFGKLKVLLRPSDLETHVLFFFVSPEMGFVFLALGNPFHLVCLA